MSTCGILEKNENLNSFLLFLLFRVRLRECVNVEFVWEFKQGFETAAAINSAIRLRECRSVRYRLVLI